MWLLKAAEWRLNMLKKSFIFKSLLILLLLSVVSLSVLSCKKDNKPDNGGAGSNTVDRGDDVPLETEGLIFNSQTKLNLVLLDYEYYGALAEDFIDNLRDNFGDRLVISLDEKKNFFEHEIVIGKSSRTVSEEAYAYLDRIMEGQTSEFGGYVLYSNGSSLALAYTKELGTNHFYDVINYLEDAAIKNSLVAKKGIVSYNIYNMYDLYGEEDKIRQDESFEFLAQQTSQEIADAVRQLYSSLYNRTYTNDVVSWLANLYEPRNCICDNYDENGVRVCLHPTGPDGKDLCSNGGFYYSNGARNTEGFLPDIESTNQALEFLEKTGMLSNYGDDYANIISGQLRADIVAFTKGLQDEGGYFYHPQWTKAETDVHWERVSRDLMWSVSILKSFNERPYYSTPAGELSGTGGRPEAVSALTHQLNTSEAMAVSKVLPTATNLPAHLQSISAFKSYLAGFSMNVYGQGYAAANALAAQVSQLSAAYAQLGEEFKTTLFNWIEEYHRADNGFWRADIDYDGANTVFKIIMVYSQFNQAFPHAVKAAESVMKVLASDEVPGHVCGAYNAWYDLAGIIGNVTKFQSAEEGQRLRESVLELAPVAITRTIENTKQFLCEDGSFSYFPDKTSETSQGMIVTPAGEMGDVNAALICTGGLIEHIGQALQVTMPPIYGTSELATFMDIIGENGFSVKDPLAPDVVADFEHEELDAESTSVKFSQGSGGSTLVVLDPKDADNQVLNFISFAKSGTWDALTIPNNTAKGTNNCLVFESNFMFASEGTSQGYLAQFYIGGEMNKSTAYFIKFVTTGTGIEVWEASSDDDSKSFSRLLGTFAYDEWFKIRVEYYMGTEDELTGTTAHDTVKIKIYTNDDPENQKQDTLVAVSSNYMDNSMKKFLEGTGIPATGETYGAQFFVMSYLECNIFFDDVYLGYKTIEYKNEKDTEGLIINEDADSERKTYDFEDSEKPLGDITIDGSSASASDGAVKLLSSGGTSKIIVPMLNRAHYSNVFSLGFDIKIDSAKEGQVFTIRFKDPYNNYNLVSYTMKCVTIDGVLSLVPVYKDDVYLNSASIPVDGISYHLEFAFFVDQATTLIYKGGEMIASTEQGVIGKCYFYEANRVEIEYSGNMVATVDNIFCERRVGDFAEETKPKYDRIVYDFNDGALGGVTSNGVVSDGMLVLLGDNDVTIPAHDRSAYISAYQLHAYIDTTKYSGDERMFVRFLDKDGNTIAGFVLEVTGDTMYLYDMVNDDKIGKYVATGNFDGTVTLDVNMFHNEKAIEVYIDEKLVLVTSIFNGGDYGTVAAAQITSKKACIDDIYLDGITLTYTAPKVNQETPDSTNGVITYDHSTLGNLPGRLNLPNGPTQSSTIDYVLRDGVLERMLIYKKPLANYPSGMRYRFREGGEKTELVFETDIKVEANEYDVVGGSPSGRSNFDILFANQSGGTQLFTAQFWILTNKETGKKHLWVNMSNGKISTERIDCGEIADDGWMNLKFKVKGGDGTANENTGAKLVLYVNGVEVLVTQHYMDIQVSGGSQGSDGIADTKSVYQAMIIPATMFTGTIYVDNTSLE